MATHGLGSHEPWPTLQLAAVVPFALALLITARGARLPVLTAGLLAGLVLSLGLLVSLATALFPGGARLLSSRRAFS